jgi:hypothetical protein
MWNRPNYSLVALSLIHVCVASSAKAQTSDLPVTRPVAPPGYVLIEVEQWNHMADEPDRHIKRARESFLKKDAKATAAELRKAAVHVRIAASHAVDRSQQALVHAENELERTARRVEAGTLNSVEELDVATSRAMHAMADYNYLKAAEAWRKRELRQSGLFLRAASDNLEGAAERTDATMRAATAEVVKDSRLVSGKLIEGTGFVVDEVGAGFEAFGRAIERVGTRVAPVNR